MPQKGGTPRKPWKPGKQPKPPPQHTFKNLSYILSRIASQLQEDRKCPFPREDLERLNLAACHARWHPLHKTNERKVFDIFQQLYSLAFPRKPNNRPRHYDEEDRTFPPDQLDVVRELSRQIISIVLPEWFGGYMRAILDYFRSRDPWVTSPFRDMSWSDLDLLLSSDDTMGFAYILSQIARSFGFDFETVRRWIQLTAISPYPPTEPFYLDYWDFRENHVGALEKYERLYPAEELRVCRLAHDAFGNLFPERVPERIFTIEELSEMDWMS
jgi:hypothetical protein